MSIEDNVLMQSLVDSTLENIATDYRNQGFEVYRDHALEGHRADLVAKKGEHVVIYEIKSGPWSEDKRREVAQLRNYVNHLPHGEFKLYFIGRPKRKSIQIEDLDRKLVWALQEQDRFGSGEAAMSFEDLASMASHVSVTSITDLEIDDITVRKSGTEVTGRGFLDVDMQFGSAGDVEKDMGVLWDDSFPMTFKLLLNSDGEILRIEELDIDISSYTG